MAIGARPAGARPAVIGTAAPAGSLLGFDTAIVSRVTQAFRTGPAPAPAGLGGLSETRFD
jgi:hypothetical protein